MKLLVIDGNSILNRAFYGIRLLSNKKGVYTNAITGFFNIYLKLIKGFKPDCAAVAFDLKAPTFRHEKYGAYKAGRKAMPDELRMQFPYVKELLRAMGITVIEKEGWEADDILGTLSHAAELSGNECVISTGDRDSFQLITDKVWVNLASLKEDVLYTPEKINEVYGVTPREMIEVKALMGDSSDNIPGVAGIGEKTALGLIQKYHSVEEIYKNLDTIEVTPSVRKKLEAGKESAELSHFLGTIALDAPIDTNIESYKLGSPNEQKLAEILTDLEMFTLLKKLDVSKDAADKALESAARSAKEEQPESGHRLIDGTDVVLKEGKAYAVLDGAFSEIENLAEFMGSDTPKRTFDVKALWTFCMPKGIEIKNVVFDTVLAAYLLNVNSSDYSMEKLCLEYGVKSDDENALEQLNSVLYSRLAEQNMMNVLTEIEIPLAEVLVSMEQDGVQLDIDGVREFGESLETEIMETEQEIYGYAGGQFNIASPKQLGEVLFERLMLPCKKKTKSGYSTNADVLDALMDKHPIVPLISKYRSLTKLNSTYVQAFLKVVGQDGRIHSTFKQTETRTGRISSADPNIQNIPVRTPLGRNMRKFFCAKPGCKLVDADYSQIELRVLAHIADDKIMQEAFRSGEDIHAITASQVFNQPLEWVTPELRSRAKAVNFGIVYGIGAYSLSQDIGVSVAEANSYIKAYLDKYSGVSRYMDKTVESAKKDGFVTTMFGRRRYIAEMANSNKMVQALGKRIAMNTPIQGTAADIIKIAMIHVYKKLRDSGLRARLILQVHDELIVEAEEKDVPQVEKLLREEMENCVKLSVPLTVDVESGNTWFDTH